MRTPFSDCQSQKCANTFSLDLGHNHRHKNIVETSIVEKAVAKYRASGFGIKYTNVMNEFLVTKDQAQRSLKHFHCKGVLFTARDLLGQGIDLLENKNPQQYFPTCIKAEILENLKKRKGIYDDPPGITILSTVFPSRKHALANVLEYQKAQILLGFLGLLPYKPPFIHKLQLMLRINRRFYAEMREMKGTKKIETYEEIIGRRHVKYTLSSNGTIQIAIRSNDTPFKLESEADVSIIFSFFGQVRDRLLSLYGDPKEQFVPSVMEWILKQCDLNKDIEIDGKAQLTLPDIQLTHMDRVFRQYVKIMNGKAYYRAEESLKLDEVFPEALNNIRNPFKSLERLERKIDDLPRNVEQLIGQKIDLLLSDHKGVQQIKNNMMNQTR